MSRSRFWMRDEEAKLRELMAEGLPWSEIATILQRTRSSVRQKAEYEGWERGGRASGATARTPLEPPRPPAPRYASLTAMAFGDPPIGRSAYDQRLVASRQASA